MPEIKDYEIDQDLSTENAVESESPRTTSEPVLPQFGTDLEDVAESSRDDGSETDSVHRAQTVSDAIAAARPETGSPTDGDPEPATDRDNVSGDTEHPEGGGEAGVVHGSGHPSGSMKILDHRTPRQIRKDRNAGR